MDVEKSLFYFPSKFAATVAVRPFLLKPQWMNGLSERLLVSHYVNNYGGAVRRLNAIRARLAALDWVRTPVFEINGLKREELIAAGSVILHEIYFDGLGGHGDNPPTGLASRPPDLPGRSSAISAASRLGAPSSPPWQRRWQAVQAGRSLPGLSAWAGWSTSGRGPRARPARRDSDLCARHVRACLSSRFWREGGRLCRSGDGKPELGADRRAVSHGDRRSDGRKTISSSPSARRRRKRRGFRPRS